MPSELEKAWGPVASVKVAGEVMYPYMDINPYRGPYVRIFVRGQVNNESYVTDLSKASHELYALALKTLKAFIQSEAGVKFRDGAPDINKTFVVANRAGLFLRLYDWGLECDEGVDPKEVAGRLAKAAKTAGFFKTGMEG